MDIEKIIQEQTQWHGKSLQGCLYAAYYISKSIENSGLERLCIKGDPSIAISEILSVMSEKILDNNNSVCSFILPDLKSLQDLITLINIFKSVSNWVVDDSGIYKDKKLVKVRIPLNETDRDGNQIYSWLLGFAPLEFLPKTRQSPYFEILLVTKSKSFFQKKYQRFSSTKHNFDSIDRGGHAHEAHLADIHIENITENTFVDNNMWENTSKRKFKILTQSGTVDFDDTTAKAKITFSYPI